MNKLLLALILIFSSAGIIYAGPFGTNMGDQKEKFQDLEQTGDASFETLNMGKNHPDFGLYLLEIPQKYGLVSVSACSHIIKNDSYGTAAKNLFDKIKEQLVSTYGNNTKKIDFLKNGSIWTQNKHWTAGINRRERFYQCIWELDGTKNNISLIILKIVALSSDETGVMLSYYYTNYAEYEKELKYKGKEAL